MKVLIACEYSGIVRTAFEKEGWEAYSCDILPTEQPGNHFQCDVMEIINNGWDLLIAFPPCTFLTNAGNKYWEQDGRAIKRIQAADFFLKLYYSNINHVCIENPVGIMSRLFRKPDQIIHPYYFGENHLKRTCLWLKNLPKLEHIKQDDLFSTKTHIDKPNPIYVDRSGKNRYFVDAISGLKNGSHLRNKSFQSIANAMAQQWTKHLTTK